MVCRDNEEDISRAKELGLRIYRGQPHVTISDSVYQVRIYLDREAPRKPKAIRSGST